MSQLGREVLDLAARTVGVGVTTEEVDRVVHEVSAMMGRVCGLYQCSHHQACLERDCYPSPLNYFNFPKSCCT